MIDYLQKCSKVGRNLQGSEIRRLFALSMQPDVISLAGGMPDPDIFPSEAVAEIVQKLLKKAGKQLMQYGPSKGSDEGIETVRYLMQRRGIAADRSQIIITSGAQQAIHLTVQVLVDPGEVILVEEPTFIGALGVFRNASAEIVPVAMDDQGLIPAMLTEICEKNKKLGKSIKLLYTIPNFQNPSGVTMAPIRRAQILQIAEQYDFIILEDDAYGELAFDLPPAATQPIKYLDAKGRVLYAGSFSKILSPGMRLGWLVAPEPLVERFDMAKQMIDVCPNPLIQAVIFRLYQDNFFEDHIPRLRIHYQKRCDAVLAALSKYMPEQVAWTKPQGGFYIWLIFPDSFDTLKLLPKALEKKVAYVIGSAFSASGELHHTLRLSFSHETDKNIEEGIKRLASTIKSNKSIPL
jgi:2-aminoadipate transaminase